MTMNEPADQAQAPATQPPADVAAPAAQPGQIPPNARSLAMGVHLLSLAGLIIPFGTILGPLVLWLVKRDEDPAVDDQGAEAVNFNISVTIYALVAAVLTLAIIGFILLPAIMLFWLIMVIVAGVKANNGVFYRYPLTIRMIKPRQPAFAPPQQ